MELKQRAIDALRAQGRRPTGLAGRAVALLMTHRRSNRRRNSWAVSLLDVRRDDRVLELGFGPGLAIRELSRNAGYVCGIDHSELMVRLASRRNADGLRRGVVDLRLAELRRLLRLGGMIALAHQPRGPGASDETSAANGRGLAAALERAGFSDVRLETLRLKPAVVCSLGVNGGGT
jgi:SAM-dependent methyltransferase